MSIEYDCMQDVKASILMHAVMNAKNNINAFINTLSSCSIEEINAKNSKGITALHLAAKYCNTCSDILCVKMLLEKGAIVNDTDNEGWTPLHMAVVVVCCSIETVYLLLKAGADVNIVDKLGLTPLHVVAHNLPFEGDEKIVDILLKYKANINIKAIGGYLPIDFSQVNNKILEMLVDAGSLPPTNNDSAFSKLIYIYNYQQRKLKETKVCVDTFRKAIETGQHAKIGNMPAEICEKIIKEL